MTCRPPRRNLQKRCCFIDFLPGTQTGTEFVGPVHVGRSETIQTSVRVKYGAQAGISGDVWGWKLNIGGGGGKETDDSQGSMTNVQYSYRPALQQVIVAGTKESRKVLYYDLKRFNQVTRAGVQDFAILAVVPKDMTEAAITLQCSARDADREITDTTRTLAVYLGGDGEARKRAKALNAKASRPVAKLNTIVTNTLSMKFASIPAGVFDMGSPPTDQDADSQDDERPQHRVNISLFYMSLTEVTVGQFRRFVEETGYKTEAERGRKSPTWSQHDVPQTDNHPVVYVSWNDAVAFCNWLSRTEERKEFYQLNDKRVTVPDWSGNGFRLPTEAEWEYACRARTTTRLSCPSGELGRYAWFKENSGGGTHPVGEKLANGFGLHDMHGNVSEWCWDIYYAYSYRQSLTINTTPLGPAEPLPRVSRGGDWSDGQKHCRSAHRGNLSQDVMTRYKGFRLATNHPVP